MLRGFPLTIQAVGRKRVLKGRNAKYEKEYVHLFLLSLAGERISSYFQVISFPHWMLEYSSLPGAMDALTPSIAL